MKIRMIPFTVLLLKIVGENEAYHHAKVFELLAVNHSNNAALTGLIFGSPMGVPPFTFAGLKAFCRVIKKGVNRH
jgi:hypothetical protein